MEKIKCFMLESPKQNSLQLELIKICKNAVAAGAAVVPPYYFFVAKSARQQDLPIPRINLDNTVRWPLKGAAIAGITISLQLSCTNILTRKLNNYGITGFYADSTSALGIAILSVPALAADNGRTFGLTIRQSISRLNILQTTALVIRESTFILGDPLGHLLNNILIQRYGDNKKTKYASAFLGGALVCFIGYPADTALTRSQSPNGLQPVSLIKSYKGVQYKAMGIGFFYCFYTHFKERLNNHSKF